VNNRRGGKDREKIGGDAGVVGGELSRGRDFGNNEET